jgi:2-phosphoglycerate kinase
LVFCPSIFDKYFLPAAKQAQYDAYKAIVEKVSNQDHLTYKGYTEIVDLVMTLCNDTI